MGPLEAVDEALLELQRPDLGNGFERRHELVVDWRIGEEDDPLGGANGGYPSTDFFPGGLAGQHGAGGWGQHPQLLQQGCRCCGCRCAGGVPAGWGLGAAHGGGTFGFYGSNGWDAFGGSKGFAGGGPSAAGGGVPLGPAARAGPPGPRSEGGLPSPREGGCGATTTRGNGVLHAAAAAPDAVTIDIIHAEAPSPSAAKSPAAAGSPPLPPPPLRSPAASLPHLLRGDSRLGGAGAAGGAPSAGASQLLPHEAEAASSGILAGSGGAGSSAQTREEEPGDTTATTSSLQTFPLAGATRYGGGGPLAAFSGGLQQQPDGTGRVSIASSAAPAAAGAADVDSSPHEHQEVGAIMSSYGAATRVTSVGSGGSVMGGPSLPRTAR